MVRLGGAVLGRVNKGFSGLLGQGIWAAADQTLFAGANFVTNLLLVRWLDPAAYGAFSLVFAAFLLLGTAHSALITEPMLVFGPGRHAPEVSGYLRAVGRLHWYTAPAALVFGGIAAAVLWAADNQGLALQAIAVGIVGPLILYQWLARRRAYVIGKPRLAAEAGIVYLALAVMVAIWLGSIGRLTPVLALVIMGVASAISGLYVDRRIRRSGEAEPLEPHEVAMEHWHYGRWALAASLLSWVPANLYYMVLPVWNGLEGTATLRALYNLVLPALHLNTALGAILLPSFVRAGRQGLLRPLAIRAVSILTAASLVYLAFLLPARPWLIRWLLDGRYMDHIGLVAVLGLLPMAAAWSAVAGDVLRAREQPAAVFRSYIAATVVSVLIGIPAVAAWGAFGAGCGLVLASLVTTAVMLLELRRSPEVRT